MKAATNINALRKYKPVNDFQAFDGMTTVPLFYLSENPHSSLLCCRWWVTRLQSWNFTWRSVISRWRLDSTSSSNAHPFPRWNGTPSLWPLLPRRTSSVCTSVRLETGQRHYWKPLGQRGRPPVNSAACQGETSESLFYSSLSTSDRKISKCSNKLSDLEMALDQAASLSLFFF